MPGLMCCGDSIFPGIGVPAVAASGITVADRQHTDPRSYVQIAFSMATEAIEIATEKALYSVLRAVAASGVAVADRQHTRTRVAHSQYTDS